LVLAALSAMIVRAAVAHATPFAYVGDGNVPAHLLVIDVATNATVASLSLGDEIACCTGVHGVAVSPSGNPAYVSVSGYSGLLVVDTTTNTQVTKIPINGDPYGVGINPTATRVYVAVAGATNGVLVVDTATNTVLTTIPLPGTTYGGGGVGPRGLVVSPDGTRVYTANFFDSTVVTIDTATNTVVGTPLTIPDGPFGPPNIADVVITPDGARLYVTKTNTYEIVVIDTATNTILTNINTENGPLGIAINPAGTRVYVGHNFANTIKVIDTTTDTVIASINAESQGGMAVTPDGTRLYACKTNVTSGVHVIDTATNTVQTFISGIRAIAYGNFIGPICPGCDDGNPCTADSCNTVSGVCTHTNITGPCTSDGNACTDDVCDGAGTCTHAPVTGGSSCNDGLFCTGTDTCDNAGTCVHTGDPCAGGPECAQTCNEATDSCFAVNTTPCTSDGNVCTDDHCDGAGACVHPANTASCDDGLFCNGADTCAGGSCLHAGNPCTGGSECADACNEAADNCFDLSGTPCTADTNPCTLDQCDGAGACGHPAGHAGTVCRVSAGQCDVPESCDGVSTTCPTDQHQPDFTLCDDGNACTTNDFCLGGSCIATVATTCDPCEVCDSNQGCVLPTNPGCGQAAPTKATIQLKGVPGDPTRNALAWKWVNESTVPPFNFGDPTQSGTDYTVCLIDNRGGHPTLLTSATAAGGSFCGTGPCWKLATNQRSASYKSKPLTPDGLASLSVKSGPPRKASIKAKAKGALLDLPGLGLTPPVTMRLQRSDIPYCWEATYSTPSANTATQFKAKSD
jgi:YVTN family beta-propeller protein